MSQRPDSLERLARGTFDLLVVGAGIVGSRIALDAASAGLRVALVDAGDFGGATSSASSKLVHGGLRYLSLGHLGVVRASRCEQQALRTRVAPHLVRDLPLLLALDREARPGFRALRGGLFVYGALSGFRASGGRPLALEEACTYVPPLQTDRLAGCALLREAQTHDARLTLATVAGAARAGAVVCNYARVVAFEQSQRRVGGALVTTREGANLRVRARAVVNAAGPWVDVVRLLEDPRARPTIRLSKGVHAVLPAPDGWRAGLALSLPGHRAVCAVPWFGALLVGVTDTPYDGDPAAAGPTPAEIRGLLADLEGVLPPELLRPERVVTAFAGLRALPPGAGEILTASRDHVVSVGTGGVVSVAGGKLTTHRRIALDALRRLSAEVRPRRLGLRDEPLAGAAPLPRRPVDVEPATWRHLTALYGAEVAALTGRYDADAFTAIAPPAPDVWAQVDHALEREWAVTTEDVLRRRTTLALHGIGASALAARRPQELPA